jgi:hypothetical protein
MLGIRSRTAIVTMSRLSSWRTLARRQEGDIVSSRHPSSSESRQATTSKLRSPRCNFCWRDRERSSSPLDDDTFRSCEDADTPHGHIPEQQSFKIKCLVSVVRTTNRTISPIVMSTNKIVFITRVVYPLSPFCIYSLPFTLYTPFYQDVCAFATSGTQATVIQSPLFSRRHVPRRDYGI